MEKTSRLAVVDKMGITLRAHLEQVEFTSGKQLEELTIPEIPETAEHLWKWFWDLDSGRGSNGFGGLEPISYENMQSYFRLTETEPQAWEVNALKRMDVARINALAKRNN